MLYRLEQCPMPGRFYVPDGIAPKAGVLVLHGSDGAGGGFHDRVAQLLACHGFAALAYDWCASSFYPDPHLPANVIDVSVDKAVDALKWLQTHPLLKGKKTGVHGFSRGGELSLLLGSLAELSGIRQPASLVAVGGIAHIWGGWSWEWDTRRSGSLNPNAHHWAKWLGKNLKIWAGWVRTSTPFDWDARAWIWQGEYLPVMQPIDLSKYNEPILLMQGSEDEDYDKDGIAKLNDLRRANQQPVEFVTFPGEPHVLGTLAMIQHDEKLLDFFARTLC